MAVEWSQRQPVVPSPRLHRGPDPNAPSLLGFFRGRLPCRGHGHVHQGVVTLAATHHHQGVHVGTGLLYATHPDLVHARTAADLMLLLLLPLLLSLLLLLLLMLLRSPAASRALSVARNVAAVRGVVGL